ncbi:FkbM family methyltransferase [Alicyclobacillus sp. SO9]|uniref:FkbM family methyltransferase n=1 Tax=Alicyclobacillus sp. SO9 TaxID=2665646 RepID=UPI0018E7A217|nr:FkbM family methyltransferase [Alicyclobacillus sp. SO9]QQE78637.1 FkbM family methyltransferase [Alicyclobacillus sp. SO9]
MRGFYVGRDRMLTFPQWGGRLYAHAHDQGLIMSQLMQDGVFEVGLTNFLIKNLKPGNTFIDAGANIGYFTVLSGILVGEKGKVIAFEPSEENLHVLKDNVGMNMLNPRTEIHNKAIYSENTTLKFYVSEKWAGTNSINQHDEEYFKYFANDTITEVEVQSTTLDETVKRIGKVDFIKIDIEGAEYHAFLGMMESLIERRVSSIIFELNQRMLGDYWDELKVLLNALQEKYGYTFHTVDDDGLLNQISLPQLFSNAFIDAVIMTA